MMENPDSNTSPRWMIAVLIVLVLGLIGLLVSPYLPGGVSLAVNVLAMTVVLPLVFWCVKWLQVQSLRRREEEALRRGDAFEAACIKAERTWYERPWLE
jgi:prepilin signal peptidase PulO-like enzyme (type II secretory pathway)